MYILDGPHSVDSVEEDGEETAVEDDEEHAQLYMAQHRRAVAKTEDVGNGRCLEDCQCKGDPGDRTERSEEFDQRVEQPAEQQPASDKKSQRDSDTGGDKESQNDAQSARQYMTDEAARIQEVVKGVDQTVNDLLDPGQQSGIVHPDGGSLPKDEDEEGDEDPEQKRLHLSVPGLDALAFQLCSGLLQQTEIVQNGIDVVTAHGLQGSAQYFQAIHLIHPDFHCL